MGNYLNSLEAYTTYSKAVHSPYFIDKSAMLDEIIPRIDTMENYICVTRPRRFGKTLAANMIASYLSKGCDSHALFDGLNISHSEQYDKHLNKYSVIFITFNRIPRHCGSYEQYIGYIEKKILQDLREAYPDILTEENDAVWDVLRSIYNQDPSAHFIFIFDEWDYIFHRDFISRKDQADYIDFLSNLLKGQPYVALAYMTGILPIAKYSSGSELNMFLEYTMASEEMFGSYFGFTENEVSLLYQKYLARQNSPRITVDGLRTWYDGYHIRSGERIYNPRSVVAALTNNNLGNYWTNSGPYDEIYYYVSHNISAIRDDLALMISGINVPAKIREYAATSMNLNTKDEIFSAMVVYGFLSFESGYVSIPNKELMDKFDEMLMKQPDLGYVYRIAQESRRMLEATLRGDTQSMTEILEFAHNTEIPLLSYNDETDLTALINLVYLSARDFYRIEREDKAGIGYVDFIFYPETDRRADCIILELKVNHTAAEAIRQIKEKQYALRFMGRIEEKAKYTGRILAVGIAYDKKSKAHKCAVEVLRNMDLPL